MLLDAFSLIINTILKTWLYLPHPQNKELLKSIRWMTAEFKIVTLPLWKCWELESEETLRKSRPWVLRFKEYHIPVYPLFSEVIDHVESWCKPEINKIPTVPSIKSGSLTQHKRSYQSFNFLCSLISLTPETFIMDIVLMKSSLHYWNCISNPHIKKSHKHISKYPGVIDPIGCHMFGVLITLPISNPPPVSKLIED